MASMSVCGISCLVMALAQARSQPIDADRILDEIESSYGRVHGAYVELVSEESPDSRRSVSVDASGAYVAFDDDVATGKRTWFSIVDGTYLYEPAPGGFVRYALKDFPKLRIWWANQIVACWPLVSGWVSTLRESPDSEVRLSGHELTLSSAIQQLSLSFDTETLALKSIAISDSTRWDFEDFRSERIIPIPGSVKHIADMPRRGPEAPATTLVTRMSYFRAEINPTDLRAHMRHEAILSGLPRYDPETGNLFDSDGKRLYNYDAYANQMLEQARKEARGDRKASAGLSAWGVAAWTGALGLGAAIGWVFVRRRRVQ